MTQFECIITEVNETTITCEMLTESGTTEIAEIEIEKFNKPDRRLLQEGLVFYLNITDKAELFIPAPPRFSKTQIREIARKAKLLAEILNPPTS